MPGEPAAPGRRAPPAGGWRRRSAASAVDLGVVLTLTALVLALAIDVYPRALIYGRTAPDAPHVVPLLYDVAALRFIAGAAAFDIWFVYQLVFTALGGTPGLRAAGLRVERAESGGRPGIGRAFDRMGGGWLSILSCGLGFAVALRDPLGRGLPERMSRLVVVRATGSTTRHDGQL